MTLPGSDATFKSLKETTTQNNSGSNVFSLIQDSVNKYVVSPANAVGLFGFIFDIDGESEHRLNSDITDHYTEKNEAYQDQIALHPEEIFLKNYVGELKHTDGNNVLRGVTKVAQKLTTITSYAGQAAAAAGQLKGILKGTTNFNESLSNVTDLWSLIKTINPFASAQQQAFSYFKALWEQRVFVSITTPYGFMKNFAIKNIIAIQGEDTTMISAFSITLKKMRIASTLTTAFDKSKFQGRSASQIEATDTKPQTPGKSVLKDIGIGDAVRSLIRVSG
jgi:hypothetical protein